MQENIVAGGIRPYFELCGGAPCLDFINTLDDRPSGQPKELLNSYSDFVNFAGDTKIIDRDQIKHLLQNPLSSSARQAFRHAIELRESLHEIFSAVIHKRGVPANAVEVLNRHLQSGRCQLVEKNKHFSWTFADRFSLEAPLWPIARSAANLLVSDQLQYVRACSSESCQWFFLDTSKNHRRRWCDMKLCGNRAKVRNFYDRQKNSDE